MRVSSRPSRYLDTATISLTSSVSRDDGPKVSERHTGKGEVRGGKSGERVTGNWACGGKP